MSGASDDDELLSLPNQLAERLTLRAAAPRLLIGYPIAGIDA